MKSEYNGLPIKSVESEITMQVDAGELGYGGICGTEVVHGQLPGYVLGCSSTKRELVVLRLAAEALLFKIKGQRVKILMDSFPAIRNLIKGGGSVSELNEEIKTWYQFCVNHKIEATYEWIRRELNQDADAASKQVATNHALFDHVHSRITEWIAEMQLFNITKTNEYKRQTNVPIHSPMFDKVQLRLTSILQGWGHSVIVVPNWVSQAWWITMKEYKVTELHLGYVHDVYIDSHMNWPKSWTMSAFLLKAIE